MIRMTPKQELLASKITTFRPSDRLEIKRSLQDQEGQTDLMQAVMFYVSGWEDADWLEDYAVERLGKWLSISANPEFIKHLETWSRLRRTKARKAFLTGIKGAGMRQTTRGPAPPLSFNCPDLFECRYPRRE